MKLSGEVTSVEAEGVTFFVALNWGQYKKIAIEFDRMDAESDPMTTLSKVEGHLLDITKRVEGLENDEGEPVTALTAEVLDQLPPRLIMLLWQRITAVGEDITQTTIPLAAASGQ